VLTTAVAPGAEGGAGDTDVAGAAPAGAVGVRISVSTVVVRLALSFVSRERGWSICDEAHRRCRCVRVADHLDTGDRPVDVFVVHDTPRHCREALDAVLRGRVRSVVLWDAPGALAAAVDGLQHGALVIPERVVELAQRAPQLSERQRRTLQLVCAGRSNAEISSVLVQSRSTTKRDLAELLELFDAANRAGLCAAASRLGFLEAGRRLPSPA
jgi:DNA-binding NarL/FixJ family response regulator